MQFDGSDIAIVGIALRVPGATTPEQFWHNLSSGVESLSLLGDEELAKRGVGRGTLADPTYVKAAMILDGVDQFDPEFFGFSAKEAAILDPQHRQFYEVCWEALERAGHPPAKFGGAIGVFAGCGMGAYFAYNILSNPDLVDSVGLFLLRHTGNDKDFLATRVSYAFNLKGPSVNVQTACSTSLVATHLAVQSLLSGECDMALAGGATIEIPHGVGYHYKEGEILSPDGHCRAFDHRSKGTVFGSGAAAVVLRRLGDAIKDGDHIHAVIKGTAVNNDGSGKVGYLAPSVEGQSAAVAEALAVADVTADTIGYVECHGTGTPVGDPIEIAALTRAFRESTDRVGYCRVGSVKSNIGHLDTAAGVAGLIKAALALEHKVIPPSLNYEAPNPAIEFAGSPFLVADRALPWSSPGAPRRAAINSLGVGGTNAFAVLEERPAQPPSVANDAPQLLVLSARSRKALDDYAGRFATWLRANANVPLADIAYTLQQGRHAFEQRRVLAASSHEEAAKLLESGDARRVSNHALDVDNPHVVFMYPGGGVQYFKMGRGLYEREPVFRQVVDEGLELLATRFNANLAPVFFAADDCRKEIEAQLAKPSVQLPLTFLVEYALTRLWDSYGIKPAALFGHSMGENTAACVAGVLSFQDALGLVLLRGQLMDEVPEGGMLSVSLPAAELRAFLGDKLDLAAANSPQLSVASGKTADLDELATRLAAQSIESQRVRIRIAAHSRLLDGILERFRAYLNSIDLHEPKLPIISNRTGGWLDPARAASPDYWVEHLRNSVLFADGVNTLLENSSCVFVEVGPGNTLSSLVRQNPRAPTHRVVASLRHPEDPVADDVYFRSMLGRLWAVGVPFDVDRLWSGVRARVPLPTYAFQHGAFWIEPGHGPAIEEEEERPLRSANLADWFRRPHWVQQGIWDLDEEKPRNWLVFRDSEPVSDALVARLRAEGNVVVTVQAGDTFERIDVHNYTVAPDAGGAGYQDLIDALVEDGIAPDRVLHTWLLTWDRSFRPGSSFFHRNQDYGFYSLFYLARALAKASVNAPLHMIVVASGSQRVREEPLLDPDKTTALGPCAVIPRELPNVTCQFVDVDLAIPRRGARTDKAAVAKCAEAVSAYVAAELTARPATTVVAWREGTRWQRRIPPRERLPAFAESRRLRRGGVYLITGGLGGIGSALAEWLLREWDARVVLVGRSPLPKRENWDAWQLEHGPADSLSRMIARIRRLESGGGRVLPVAADVTVAEHMREVIAEAERELGPINGVFHAAGVVRDNLIPLKGQREIEEVFAAKVYGTLVLDEIFKTASLDFMILFSSASSFVAPQGQVDYVGANSFMNAFAEHCAGARAYPVTAINWGIWKDVGMVAPPQEEGSGRDGDADTAHATMRQLDHAVFARAYSAREGTRRVEVFEGDLSAARHWIIDEHRLINGEALLPGTGYIDLLRAGLAELGHAGPWRIDNLTFHDPLFVEDGEQRRFRLRLRGDRERWDVTFLARQRTGGWTETVTARVADASAPPPAALDLARIADACRSRTESAGGTSALRTAQEAHLKFGPRWHVLKRIDYGTREALARLSLAPEFAHELESFALHPGLLDIATGCAMELIAGYAERDVADNLWVPISYRQIRYHAPLQADVVSWIRVSTESSVRGGYAAFDVTITAPDGRVLVEVEQLTVRQLDRPLRAANYEAPRLEVQADGVAAPPARKLSPSEAALHHNRSQGILAHEGIQALAQVLQGPMPPTVIVSSMDPAALLKQAENISKAAGKTTKEARFSRPELDSDFEAPRNEVESGLAEMWGRLLGVEGVGIHDSFFDLGGHSLVAVRLFNEIADRYGTDLPMSVLMQTPTIAGLAALVQPAQQNVSSAGSGGGTAGAAQPAATYQYIVPMHAGPVASGTPLFVVAGMFGNVLNLSHLAHLLGEERPFYAIQARGLYGDTPPHETFEEMATDYIAEMRKVQPQGPYLLGGFSGGGIAAYEMARQLIAQGEQVTQLVLLDTPLPVIPTFGALDRGAMLWQRIKSGGLAYVSQKIAEKAARLTGRVGADVPRAGGADAAGRFQSERIGAAFMRAVARYGMAPAPVDVAVFRPRQVAKYRLRGGRRFTADLTPIYEDNGWGPFVSSIEVHEVPGNHDSMVLEPNVRVLVSSLRRSIEESEAAAKSAAPVSSSNEPRQERREQLVRA